MSDYEAALEKQIDEQQRKIAKYEVIVETLLPLVCHCNSQFESDYAWLDAILPKLKNTMSESDVSHHEKVTFNAKMRANDCENAFICCSRLNEQG
jgi:hypothetical protein